jgi:signal transduction histidine kinase
MTVQGDEGRCSTIAGGVAHNFNNLLAIILGNLDLASQRSSDIARLHGHLDAARLAAERGANLTWQLLAFARQQPLCPEPIEPSGQLRDLSMLIAESFPANIRIETDIPPDLWVVEVDPSEFQLALLNLGFNARDATPGGGVLRISAKNRLVPGAGRCLAGLRRCGLMGCAHECGDRTLRTTADIRRAKAEEKNRGSKKSGSH